MIDKSETPERFVSNKTGMTAEFLRRTNLLFKDPKVREGAIAGLRTLVNVGISMADLIPGGVGEIPDFVAAVAKFFKDKKGVISKFAFDLTPDVSSWANVAPNVLEPFTAGVFPSYVVPTGFQAIKDVPRMFEGAKEAIKIITNEKEDYKENKTAIDAAINFFN